MGQSAAQNRRALAEEFAEGAADLSAVRSATVDEGERRPPLVTVEVSDTQIPAHVLGYFDTYYATIESVRYDGSALLLSLSIPRPWKDGGTRKIRAHGSSLVLTLPREALDAADIGTEKVAIHARDGEIHVQKQERGSRLP